MILIGLFSLSLVLPYPYKQMFGTKPNPKNNLYFHLFGWALFLLSMIIAVNTFGLGMGITYWFGYLTLMALLLVTFYSTYQRG